jgi:hypothetical protein
MMANTLTAQFSKSVLEALEQGAGRPIIAPATTVLEQASVPTERMDTGFDMDDLNNVGFGMGNMDQMDFGVASVNDMEFGVNNVDNTDFFRFSLVNTLGSGLLFNYGPAALPPPLPNPRDYPYQRVHFDQRDYCDFRHDPLFDTIPSRMM